MLVSALSHRDSFYGLAILLLLSLLVTGCSHQPAAPVGTSGVPPTVQPFTGHVTVYAVDSSGQSTAADANDLVPIPITIDPKSKAPARLALDALISVANSPLPHGTKLLGITIDSTGLATVNFSKEFKDNFTGGDTKEAQVLTSVEMTLGQFPSVSNIQFLVGGAKIDTLGGMEDLSSPLPAIKATDESASAT